jgi:nucleoside-diphosphate-sugar epimerase
MTVLITGGTGFIGSRLALRCLDSGERVRVLALVNDAVQEQNRALIEARGGEIAVGSITDRAAVQDAVAGARSVFHLAAAQHEMNVPDEHFWDINVEGTRTLLEAAAAANVESFVHGSTIGVYGAAEGEIDEATPMHPDNIYGLSKAKGERLALSYAPRVPLTVIRIAEVYGPGDRRLLKLFRAINQGTFVMIGRGDNLHQPIYVDDLIEGLRVARSSPRAVRHVFVLAGPEPVTTAQMVEAIADALGKRRRVWRLPMWPFLATAVVLEGALRPLGVQPPLHRRRMDFFRKSLWFSIDRAKAELGFVPKTDFRRGAALTAAWYAEHGEL